VRAETASERKMRVSLKRPGWLVMQSYRHVAPQIVFWAGQGLGWCALTVVLIVIPGGSAGNWALASQLATGSNGILVSFLCWVLMRHLWRYGIRGVSYAVAILGTAMVGALFWANLEQLTLHTLRVVRLATPAPESAHLIHSFWFRASFLGAWELLYSAMAFSIEIQLARARIARAEVEAQKARLRALQTQMQPHFLFNNLNAISVLVGDGHAQQARAALSLVAEFLRRTMTTRDVFEITVAEELEALRLYLELVELRFGDRVRSSIDVEPIALSRLMPSLMLQPIVENAVRHGLLPRLEGGAVSIELTATGTATRIRVEDDGVGLKSDQSLFGGMGLSNCATRLSDLYGGRATIAVKPRECGGVRVEITIPRRDITESAIAAAHTEEWA
jgi:two-component system, LytTR family, sensor kinase